jgi:hypothetical protein
MHGEGYGTVRAAGMTSYPDERWMVRITGSMTMANWTFLPLNADAEQ